MRKERQLRRSTFRAISSGSDSPRRENKIANDNFKTESNNTTQHVTLEMHWAKTYDYQDTVWMEAMKFALAVFLFGQIYVGSSKNTNSDLKWYLDCYWRQYLDGEIPQTQYKQVMTCYRDLLT
ncbi:unnamed protein product [Acanthoscelides obtectus]|uniref:Uncharacterized protein n=1 Tax=Acanthoscelides obtectus TaxID=200917 RepID=A0A9P0VR35_ACAOB|nr:unnamed protein product [Acanthoscelides obtectus]CAK1676836.1 hypothetical protein AOBTE_LOCUS30959 [Acanthoscelides obtectus]